MVQVELSLLLIVELSELIYLYNIVSPPTLFYIFKST